MILSESVLNFFEDVTSSTWYDVQTRGGLGKWVGGRGRSWEEAWGRDVGKALGRVVVKWGMAV